MRTVMRRRFPYQTPVLLIISRPPTLFSRVNGIAMGDIYP